MKLKFFDLEIYNDYWCCAVSDEEDSYVSKDFEINYDAEEERRIKDNMRIYDSDMPDGREKLIKDLSTGVMCAYNLKRYDIILINAISLNFTCSQLKILNDIIIHPDEESKFAYGVMRSKIAPYANRKWKGNPYYQDLMDDVKKGLKDKEASLGLDIRETPIDFDIETTTQEQRELIRYYNKHDVYAMHIYYACCAQRYIRTKLILGELYNIPLEVVYRSTNAVLCGTLLKAKRVHGTDIIDPTIEIYNECIKNYIDKWCPEKVRNHLYSSQRMLKINLLENEYTFADGGIHSTYNLPDHRIGKKETSTCLYAEADTEYGLFNIDVSSCYTSCMVFAGSISRSISEPEILINIFTRRRQLKKIPKSQYTSDDKRFVSGGKLVLNTVYGAMGNKFLELYDAYMRSKTCRVGQLILISVCHDIKDAVPDAKILQTNTDGILVYCRKSEFSKIQERVTAFEELSGFEFEVDEDAKIWQSNVNNYMAVSTEGEIKDKGESYITSIFQPGYYHLRPLSNYVLNKAKKEFYLTGYNPAKYISENNEVQDFVLQCTKGATYSSLVQVNADETIELGKCARVIAVTDNSLGIVKKVSKRNINKMDTCALCPPHALIVNDNLANYHIEGPAYNKEVVHKDGRRYKLDMAYYFSKLIRDLDVIWYKLKYNKVERTYDYNLGGD